MKYAVVYHYFEKNPTYRDNLIFFLNTAVYPDVEYFIIISGFCSVELTEKPNIQYINIPNKNYDFGGIVEFSKNPSNHSYDGYIFVNSSVRGPFIAPFYPFRWYEAFTSGLNQNVAIVGTSINFLPEVATESKRFSESLEFDQPYIHVQTTSYALSGAGFRFLLSEKFFSLDEELSHTEIVLRYEIKLSQLLLKQGYEISALLPTYENFDASNRRLIYPTTLTDGDPLMPLSFYGRTISPLEGIFVKINRNLITPRTLASYTFTSLARHAANGRLSRDGAVLFAESEDKMLVPEQSATSFTVRTLEALLTQIKDENKILACHLKNLL